MDAFECRVGENQEWAIEAKAKPLGGRFRAESVAERAASDGDEGEHLVFSDLGDFDTAEQAIERALRWTKNWVEENF